MIAAFLCRMFLSGSALNNIYELQAMKMHVCFYDGLDYQKYDLMGHMVNTKL